jgi:diguanylate cyclase (GGDEF)-like protein
MAENKVVISHHSKYDLSILEEALRNDGYKVISARFFAEISNQINYHNHEIVAGFAAVGKEDISGIEFLRSLMIHNLISQRVMLSHTEDSDLLRAAINRSHINYVLDYPVQKDEIEKYLVKIQRRYNHLVRPFQKYDALSEVTEDLLNQNEKFRKEATSDTLTRLYNRRSFNSFLERYWEMWESKKVTFCLAILDLDHFKNVNDTYGHIAGDKVLQSISELLYNNKRTGIDFLFRYGGEEFAIISNSITIIEMQAYVVRMNQMIRELSIAVRKRVNISITVSAGICCVEKSKSIQDLIEKADKALYNAKNAGRDRVLVYEKRN